MFTRIWWRSLACMVLLLVVSPLAMLWLWPERDLGQECLDKIHLGMSWGEAEGVLVEYGFKPSGGTVLSGQLTRTYKGEGGQVICLVSFPWEAWVGHKELQRGPREGPLERLRRLLRMDR
jgi:hypothetical protein